MSAPPDGVTVIDLSRALAGPQVGIMLGDLAQDDAHEQGRS